VTPGGGSVPVEDRLFSLVLALLATASGLTKTEILSTVRGYAQRYVAGGDNANLERQFERDKDDLRELGVPLEIIEPLGEPGDNHHLRYRIPKGAYELPEDVRFNSDEVALLGLAAMAWREGSLSAESRRALVKLRALGISADDTLVGYAPRLRLRDAAFEPLTQAIDRGLLVRFDYLKPGDARARTREVIPLALVQFDGRWHLAAEELATGEGKTFLLRRIVGKVVAGKQAPNRPGDHTARALAELEELWRRGVADIEVRAGSDAALRLAHRRGTEEIAPGILRVHHVDVAVLADELAGFGPEVVVVAPEQLRRAVIARLERTVADHG